MEPDCTICVLTVARSGGRPPRHIRDPATPATDPRSWPPCGTSPSACSTSPASPRSPGPCNASPATGPALSSSFPYKAHATNDFADPVIATRMGDSHPHHPADPLPGYLPDALDPHPPTLRYAPNWPNSGLTFRQTEPQSAALPCRFPRVWPSGESQAVRELVRVRGVDTSQGCRRHRGVDAVRLLNLAFAISFTARGP